MYRGWNTIASSWNPRSSQMGEPWRSRLTWPSLVPGSSAWRMHITSPARVGALWYSSEQRAQGASIRNFGMLWPIGQPAGPLYRLARRSLEIWLEVLGQSRLWHSRCGSLHLAYHDDETQVLREFAAVSHDERGCDLLSPAEVLCRYAAVRPDGLRAGLWSPVETCVDPRQVIAGMPGWLSRTYGVEFRFGVPVVGYERPVLRTALGEDRANQLIMCSGDELESLFPAAFRNTGLVRCKLQMMRSATCADGWRLGPMLAAGLTLRHYASFADCPSLAALKTRFDRELPDYGRFGIHVMAAQNGKGELVLGDSHEYGDRIEIYDKPEIDDLILAYLRSFLSAPELRIAARWHGAYVKHPNQAYLVLQPADGVTVVTGVGGAGMTLSFGLAEQIVETMLG
jgi:D-hydroxyproline dehydrogenase subunit beta